MTMRAPILVTLLLAACAADADQRLSRLVVRTAPAERPATTAAASAPSAAASASAPLPPQSPQETAIWRSEAFRRQFTLSYAAESEVEPRLSVSERDLMQKVFDLIAAEKTGEAQRLLEAAAGPNTSAVVDFTIANLHFQQERLDEALLAYRAAVDKFPKFRRAWRNMALIHVRRTEYVDAADGFVRVLELGGGDSTVYGLLGYSHANQGSHLAAESAYRMACLLDPKLLDWQLGLARSLFEQQRFAEAAALLDPLLKRDPDRGDFWMLQGNAYLGLNQAAKAAECLEMVDRLGQSTPDTLNTLGDIYVNDELFDLAVAAYMRAIDAGQQNPERAIRAVRVLIARGAFEETRALLGVLDTVYGPKLADAQKKELLFLRSRLAMAEGAGEEEARVLEQIVALDPLDGEALLLLGQHSQRTGNPEKAIFYYERAAGIESYEADAKVRHAQLLIGQGKYRDALPLLERAQAVKPRDNVAQYLEQVERLAGGK